MWIAQLSTSYALMNKFLPTPSISQLNIHNLFLTFITLHIISSSTCNVSCTFHILCQVLSSMNIRVSLPSFYVISLQIYAWMPRYLTLTHLFSKTNKQFITNTIGNGPSTIINNMNEASMRKLIINICINHLIHLHRINKSGESLLTRPFLN